MDIPNKNTEIINDFLTSNIQLKYREEIQLGKREEQVLRLFYGLGPMPGIEPPVDEEGKSAWDGSSIEEIAKIFDETHEEIENIKCMSVMKFIMCALTITKEFNEDEEVEYDLRIPTDPDFSPDDIDEDKVSIFTHIDFSSKEKLSESCDEYMISLLTEDVTEDDETDLLDWDERQELISNLLNTLTEREGKVLSMYFGLRGLERCSVEEIGEVFDITKRSVKRIKNRGVLKMIYRVTKLGNPTYAELASHIDKDLIDSCIKDRGRLYDKFMNLLIDPSEG